MSIHEKIIIGGIAGGTVKPSTVNLGLSDFEDTELGQIFLTAILLEAEKKEITPELLHARISEKESLGFFAASDFHLMAQSAKSASVVMEAVDRIKNASLKKYLLERTAQIALQDEKSGAHLLDELKAIISNADTNYKTSDNNFIFLKDLLPKMEAVYTDLWKGISYAVPTGFQTIDDNILDGFTKGDLHVICGFTGSGKSALALNFAKNQAKAGKTVGIVSREMSDIENIIRLQSTDSQIPRWKIRKDMWDITYRDLMTNLQEFADLRIAFDTRTTDIEALRPQVKMMCETEGLDILYVDYLQLMKSGDKSSRANEVQFVSHELKEIAMENHIPVVPLCQFSREAKNANLFELLACLKESSAIEQDASTVLYIQLEKTEEKKRVKDAQAYVLKNRNGVCFAPIDLFYHGECFEFSETEFDNEN